MVMDADEWVDRVAVMTNSDEGGGPGGGSDGLRRRGGSGGGDDGLRRPVQRSGGGERSSGSISIRLPLIVLRSWRMSRLISLKLAMELTTEGLAFCSFDSESPSLIWVTIVIADLPA
jgi:hypothetical protein